jgi:hypothetical protein
VDRSRIAAAAAVGMALAFSGGSPAPKHDAEQVEGYAEVWADPIRDDPRAVVAAFDRRSYAPGARARLVIWSPVQRVSVQFFHVGAAPVRPTRVNELRGAEVSPARELSRANARGRWRVRVQIPDGTSGLYYLELRAPGGRIGYAPFVLRPGRPGTSRVLVVLPTNTWQAYNFRDVDRDGIGDTWYADPRITTVDIARPFEQRGVPRHFGNYDSGFLRWLFLTGESPDFLADDDVDLIDARTLVRRYDLVVFPGHEEYVTGHVFSLIRRYRDLGGNLAFLSANNFFYRVDRRGSQIVRVGRWRDLGRPEASVLGVQYVGCCEGVRARPYVVVGARRAPWLFRGTGLQDRDRFGGFGIEIDQTHPASPRGTRVLARIPNMFSGGRSAEMTYYETPRGAKVFAAGVLNFGGSALQPIVRRMLENLWAHLGRP